MFSAKRPQELNPNVPESVGSNTPVKRPEDDARRSRKSRSYIREKIEVIQSNEVESNGENKLATFFEPYGYDLDTIKDNGYHGEWIGRLPKDLFSCTGRVVLSSSTNGGTKILISNNLEEIVIREHSKLGDFKFKARISRESFKKGSIKVKEPFLFFDAFTRQVNDDGSVSHAKILNTHELFKLCLDRWGDSVNQGLAFWVKKDSGSDNWGIFNKALDKGFSVQDSARKTPEGRAYSPYGFTEYELLGEYSPSRNVKVQVGIFKKPEDK
ncbi:MAG: hypothetical protein WCJ19_01355 [bacterium]